MESNFRTKWRIEMKEFIGYGYENCSECNSDDTSTHKNEDGNLEHYCFKCGELWIKIFK